VHFLVWTIQRFEKPQALDMIHMEVREKQIEAWYLGPYERSQASNPSASVEHDQRPILAANLDTRGIPAIAHRLGSGCGQ
jgi:hypothetical protein